MSEQQNIIRRILVALDASTYSLAALQAAVALAAEQDAEVVGLFVEDINLLRLSELPFAREVRWLSARTSQLNSQSMIAAMQIQAARARRALERAAAQAQVSASFRIVRGQVPLELLAASLEADLLILGRASQPRTRRVKAGSTARLVALQASRTVLLTKPALRQKQSVMVAFDGSDLGWRALATAVPLLQPDQTLIILLINGSLTQQEQWRRDTANWLQQRRIKLEYRYLSQAVPYQLAQIAHNSQCSLLILSDTIVATSKDTLYALLDLIDCSLMIVR